MSTDVDEPNSTLGDEAAREANSGAEQLGSLVDGQQLFHDRALLWREVWGSATVGCFMMITEQQVHHQSWGCPGIGGLARALNVAERSSSRAHRDRHGEPRVPARAALHPLTYTPRRKAPT